MRNVMLITALCIAATGCKPGKAPDPNGAGTETSVKQKAVTEGFVYKKVAAKKSVTEEVLQSLRSCIQSEVDAGFRPEEEIAESAVDAFDEYDADALTPEAERITRELIAAHKQEQAGWPKTTDCDRLDTAFAKLESTGVVCRQNFTCCGTCGTAEIGDEIDVAAKGGKRVRGYTFYHMQDTESAVDGQGLCLNYGAVEEGEAAALAVGKEIAAALKQEGLQVEWNGSWDKRISVEMDWKRRR